MAHERESFRKAATAIGAGVGDRGESYVVFGSTQGFPAVFPLASLYPAGGDDGTPGFVLRGNGNHPGGSGRSVSAAGDVNGDGIDDVIIGAPFVDRSRDYSAEGESYVVFGSRQGFPAIVQLASLYPNGGGDGTHGFVLTGFIQLQNTGRRVSAAGDIDGNGIGDLIIGGGDTSFRGESYAVFGSMQAFPPIVGLQSLFPAGGGDGSRGFVLRNDRSDAGSACVSAAGDVNGDGIDDVIIGNAGAGPGGADAGESYVVFGRAAAP
jgi:glycosylphosphatidylinositol phospholipase D